MQAHDEAMKRTTYLAAVMLAVALMACTPTPTVTATPSTLRPACKEITTVTGTTAPKDALKNVVLETQRSTDGAWVPFYWFRTGASGEGKSEIRSSVPSSGAYTLTYAQPLRGTATFRLRVRAMKLISDAGVVSRSWYVTPPSVCP